eukprot:1602649-Rhodomonas_salina.1
MVRQLITMRAWDPAICYQFLSWWSAAHAGILNSIWVAPVELMAQCVTRGSLSYHSVFRHGPDKTKSVTSFWFLLASRDNSWSAIGADLATATLSIYGRPDIGAIRLVLLWLDTWLGTRRPPTWTSAVTHAVPWTDTALFLAGVLSLALGTVPSPMDEDLLDCCRQAM